MAEFSPAVNLTVEDTLSGSGNEQNIALEFKSLKDFEPEQVAKKYPTASCITRYAQFIT